MQPALSPIGLNDVGTEGEYEWSDGAALGSYTSWAPMAPNDGDMEVAEDCATDYLDYICEGPL